MKIAKSTLATALATLMSLGVAGQASAYTSAGSVIEYTNLSITITDTNTVDNFNFVTTNTTSLNGTTIADSDQCGGVPAFPTSLDNCADVGPVLDSDLQLLGTSTHTENDFTLDGPNAGTQYSYSDSVVYTSELTPVPGANTTAASLIAETELLTTGGGNSTSTIQSTTGFTFTFTVTGTGSLTISFNADPDMYAASDNPGSIVTLAEASIASTLTLSQDGGTGNAEWSPDGDATNGCTDLAGGVTCSGEADPNSLNNKVAITTDGTSDLYNPANGLYTITIDNLTAGDWSFSLTTTVANSVTKIKAVPEPTTLLLLGAGLAGLGATRRRSRKA